MYRKEPNNPDDVENPIRDACQQIISDTLERVQLCFTFKIIILNMKGKEQLPEVQRR